MTLLETVIEVTGDASWPTWLVAVVTTLATLGGAVLLKYGIRFTVSPKPDDSITANDANLRAIRAAEAKPVPAKPAGEVTGLILVAALSLTLSGCAAGIQKDAARASINVLEPVVHDLEDRAGATASERQANQKQLDTLKEAVK